MATITTTILVDDIDGTPTLGTETVNFSIDGKHYEIDLSPKNRETFHAILAPYTEKGRTVVVSTRKSSRAPLNGTKAGDIRTWAIANNIDVSARGRIPASVREQYLAAKVA
jgi:Lsr2